MTYPNVLVLDYMRSTGQATPELEMQAEQYISVGYQRLLTFETPDGGFSLFGRPPTEVFLTAYGLMELHDMSRVYPVDEEVIARKARWLLEHQNRDGSWTPRRSMESWRTLPASNLPATAYATWALSEAGYTDTKQVRRAVVYLQSMAPQVEDAYTLALMTNALVSAAPDDAITRQVLEQLAGMAVIEGETAYWPSGVSSFMGARGSTANIEATALAVYALLRGHAHPSLAQAGLTYLVRHKDSFGTWETTQATILSLKAMLLAATMGAEQAAPTEATVYVEMDGQTAEPIAIHAGNADVVHSVFFDDVPLGDSKVYINMVGQGNLMYQLTTAYYLPWELVPPEEKGGEALTIDVRYDRTDIQVNDTIVADVRIGLNQEGTARMVLVDLGLPPGFSLVREDLDELVRRSADMETRISRYEVTGRQVILYIENLRSGTAIHFTYRLRAKYPLRAKTAPFRAYDYYSPSVQAEQEPVEIVVRSSE